MWALTKRERIGALVVSALGASWIHQIDASLLRNHGGRIIVGPKGYTLHLFRVLMITKQISHDMLKLKHKNMNQSKRNRHINLLKSFSKIHVKLRQPINSSLSTKQ